MKTTRMALMLVGTVLMAACTQQAPPGTATAQGPGAAPAWTPPPSGSTCLRITDIETITALDDSTLLFKMIGNHYYINHLPFSCPMLKWAMDTGAGIAYNADPNGAICDNVYTFRVLKYGATCGFGQFVPYTPMPRTPIPAAAPPPPPQ
jgi:hypothetical protein